MDKRTGRMFPNRGKTVSQDGGGVVLPSLPPWKVIIVDDEPDVHQLTRLVLRDFVFDGRHLEFYSGYSSQDAKNLIRQHQDAAIILLDVVMEADDSGLQVVQFIRQEIKNPFMRIILRTGQPGQAPEAEVTAEYDINDYREKTSLTGTTLTTSMLSSLRAYRDIRTIENTRTGLQKIIRATGELFEARSLRDLATRILTQMVDIVSVDGSAAATSQAGCFVAAEKHGSVNVYAAIGQYAAGIGRPVGDVVSADVLDLINKAKQEKSSQYRGDNYLGYFNTRKDKENLLYFSGRPLSQSDQDLLAVFSLNIAAAFENLFLNREIINTQKDVTFTLGEVIEVRSGEAGHHVRRVAESSRLLASLIGLSPQEVELIWLASPLHDLGKIGIPDLILNKPGKLTPEEWAVIKEHPLIGYKILQGQERDVIKAGAMICYQHHEKWDGSGYPEGLQGDAIHIFARITGLVDVFDALFHTRCYKPAWPLEKILTLMKEERGRHFEPRLVDVFLENYETFLGIHRAYQ